MSTSVLSKKHSLQIFMTLTAEFAFELIPFYFLQTDSVINKGILISERIVAIKLIEINAIRHFQISSFHINCLCTDPYRAEVIKLKYI